MEYIVLDLEWNQPECRRKMIKSPIKLTGEIIQIGAAKVNEKLEVLDTFNMYIKPVYYPKMNRKVSEVTGLQILDLAEGVTFREAAEAFKKWCGGAQFISWGPDDLYMLEDNLYIHGLDTSWLPEVFDAQEIFDNQVTMEGRQFALSYAIYHFKLKCLEAHNALNDTLNTVSVLRCLDFIKGIKDQYDYYYAPAM